jgi:hypothetical protein
VSDQIVRLRQFDERCHQHQVADDGDRTVRQVEANQASDQIGWPDGSISPRPARVPEEVVQDGQLNCERSGSKVVQAEDVS